eukprot:COSAG02_NODE_9366_length_2240_cov_0.993461_1_plen_113_part_10
MRSCVALQLRPAFKLHNAHTRYSPQVLLRPPFLLRARAPFAALVRPTNCEWCPDPKAYKTQARNIFANIDAPDNPTFRLRVLTGQIPSTAVATLRPGAMASAEQQAKDSQIDK